MIRQKSSISLIAFFCYCIGCNRHVVDGAKFSTTGPILTVTLKDPYAPVIEPIASPKDKKKDLNSGESEDEVGLVYKKNTRRQWSTFGRRQKSPSSLGQMFGMSSLASPSLLGQMFGMPSLAPTCLWQVETLDPPFPDFLPFIRKAGVTLGYRYDELRNMPCFIEGDLRLGLLPEKYESVDDMEIRPYDSRLQVHIKPVYHLAHNIVKCAMRVMGRNDGESRYAMAQFHVSGGPEKSKVLELIRGSFDVDLPFASVSSISVTPSHDFLRGETTCTMVGQSGSRRTAAVLDLNRDDPKLSIVHALDRRNTVSPEISLYNAQIKYKWNMLLGDSGSINTVVDPTKAVQLTWTDRSMNGKWVTDFRLPLANSNGDNRPLTTDIRVRRQFTF